MVSKLEIQNLGENKSYETPCVPLGGYKQIYSVTPTGEREVFQVRCLENNEATVVELGSEPVRIDPDNPIEGLSEYQRLTEGKSVFINVQPNGANRQFIMKITHLSDLKCPEA